MSKYVDSVKSARPEHLYVLDVDRATLDGGTVSDLGFNPIDAVVEEDTGFAEIQVLPALVAGLKHSVHVSVIHDVSSASASNYFSALSIGSGVAEQFFGPTGKDNWSIELVVKPENYVRARDNSDSYLIAVSQTGVNGLAVVYDFTGVEPTVEFKLTLDFDEAAGTEVFRTAGTYDPSSIYHLVLTKVGSTYSLYVNGSRAGYGTTNEDHTLTSPVGSMRLGGWSAFKHADATIQSVATFNRSVSPQELKSRYQNLDFVSSYTTAARLLSPAVSIDGDTDGSTGTLEPFYSGVSTGADSDDFYENELQELMIQPSELAVGVSKVKKLKFDLSGLDSGVSTYLNVTTTTDANSSIVVEYSFDDVSYSTWTEGEDNIEELDANWGGVV